MLHQKLKTMGSNQQSENLSENNENKMKVQMKAQELYMKGKQKFGRKCEPNFIKKSNGGSKKSNIEGNGGAKKISKPYIIRKHLKTQTLLNPIGSFR
jgi:hypothetical protein